MKKIQIKILLSLLGSISPILMATCQLTLTTVNDPLLGSTKIKGVSRNQFGETLLLSEKNIYTFINEVTDVYTCDLCNDIRDVAMIGDTMFIGSASAGIVKRFGDSEAVVTTLRAERLVSGNGGKLYGVDFLDGLDYWDGSTWRNLKTSNSSIPTNDLFDVVLDHNGLLWIASQIGLISWDGTTFSKKSVPSELSAAFIDVRVDADNNIWVTSAYGGVGKYSGNSWTTFTSTFSDLATAENLAVLNNNEIWTSDYGVGLYRYDGAFNEIPFSTLGVTEWYPNSVLYGDAQNRLWIQNDFTALRYLTTGPSATNDQLLVDQGIVIYPNPTSDESYLKCIDHDNYILEVQIITMEGKLMQTQSIPHQNQVTLRTNNLQPGIYCLKIKASDGFRVLKLNKLN